MFLDGACGADAALRVEIEALLASHEEAEAGPALNVEAGNTLPGEGITEITPTLLDETPLTEGPGAVIGRYKLLEKIGEGGCGVVYMAEQEEPVKRRVALKVIKLGMDTRQVIARFEAERQALALMDHPNIAKVLDAGATEAGRPFFVMELVRGHPHHRLLRRAPARHRGAARPVHPGLPGHPACAPEGHHPSRHQALQHPGHRSTTAAPVPKVIDFGIAKATAGQTLTDKTLFTAFEQFIGTPAYMSPEQAEMSGLDIDTRSDIYSLGVLLYELLTGKTPFDAKQLLAAGLDGIRRTIWEKDPARPSIRLAALKGEDYRRQRRAVQPIHRSVPRAQGGFGCRHPPQSN